MTSGVVRQVVYGQVIQTVGSIEEWEAHALSVGVVCSGDVARSTSSFRIALLDFIPPPHPHSHMFSDLWLAVPGHYGTLTNPRSSTTEGTGVFQNLTPSRASSLRVRARLWCMLELGSVRRRQGWNVDYLQQGQGGGQRQKEAESHSWTVW